MHIFSRRRASRVALVTGALVILVALVAAVLSRTAGVGADLGHGANGNLAQQLAVPAYIDPPANPAAWAELTSPKPETLGIVVANVDSGPGSAADPAWATAIQQSAATGAKVLGYVDTGYLGSPIVGHPNGLLTRSGLTGFDAWLPQIEADINAWYQFYGANIGGIFFDEGTNECGSTATTDDFAQDYQALTAYVKGEHSGALTAINPGTAVPQCYEGVADVLVTFEGSYGDYTGSPASPAEAYQPLSWVPVDPYQIWHIIYGASNESQEEQVMALSKARDAGYVYVTNDVPANPYDTIPPPSYWSDEQDESYPFGNPGSRSPTSPTGVSASPGPTGAGATSVNLTWQPSNGNSAPVVAYNIYQNGQWLGAVAANQLAFTASGLNPSTSYSFTVDAQDSAENSSSQSSPAPITTAAADPVLPFAPVNLSVTSTSFGTATLSWTSSSSPGQSIAQYVIDQDGSPILMVPGSMTTLSVQGLLPGLSSYTFSVSAEGSTGNDSPPSNLAVATTVPLPGDQAISAPSVQDNGNGTLTYSAQFATPFAFRRAFISTGSTPCWTTGNSTPLCSNYLIENGTVYSYAGSGTDFTWNTVDSVAPSLTGAATYSWTIPATDIGSPAGQNVLFEGDGYSPAAYSGIVQLGTAPALPTVPYPPGQEAALAQYVNGQLAAMAPVSTGPSTPITDANCPATADDTWHVTRSDSCLVGSVPVNLTLLDGLLPNTFTLGVTDSVSTPPAGRTWTENVSVVLEPVAGTVPDYTLTLTPNCSNSSSSATCSAVTPVTLTLVPGITTSASFSWSDPASSTDVLKTVTAGVLTPILPPLTLPFTPPVQTASVQWSTPVVRCDSTAGAALAGCVFPEAAPTMSELSLSNPVLGSIAAEVQAFQKSSSTPWGVPGSGNPLALTTNQSLIEANLAAACRSHGFGQWAPPSSCEEFPFSFTYQGAAEVSGGITLTASSKMVAALDSLFTSWEQTEHVLDGDQFYVQIVP